MANVKLNAKTTGSTVKLKVNGSLKNFVVISPAMIGASLYYDGFKNGDVILLSKDIYANRQWHTSIAIFKIKAHIRMNETILNSQKTKHSERRVRSQLEVLPMSWP